MLGFFNRESVYQEGVAAVSTGDSGPGWLGVRTGRTRMNWTQINYPLTGKRDRNTKSTFTPQITQDIAEIIIPA